MIRDLSRLAEREFDVLVVGGGIYGLTIAYDAAQRGLAVALVERGDFGSGTSFNHLKTIHGGLRYLQSVDLRRMRESIRERRAFARIAPRFVAPLAFAMPTGASPTRHPLLMRAALAIDAFVGHDRNDGVDVSRRLPAGSLVAGEACRTLFEGAIPAVSSAAMWHDYQTLDGDRLTLSFAKAAADLGAALANYAEATGLERGERGLHLVKARDHLTAQTFDIRARVIVNAAGPWRGPLLETAGLRPRWPLLKAMNLVTSRPAPRAALVAPTRAGRALILLPWRGRALVGTAESREERRPDDQGAVRGEVDAFLAEVNATFPALGLRADEITLVHRGIVPASTADGGMSLLAHSLVVDHRDHRDHGDYRAPAGAVIPGVVSVIGVKYTTARAVAERAVDLIFTKLGRPPVVCRTAETPLPGASLIDRDPADPVAHAIREEMAHTLVDVVVRRTGLGAAGYPGDAEAMRVAARMQAELGWSEERRAQELQSLKPFYDIT